MKIYIVRHGETECNANSICYGWYDCPLNEKGVMQAKNLGEFFKTKKIDKIISSDLSRAKMTAEAISKTTGVEVEHISAFREMNFGDWENVPIAKLSEIDPVNALLWRDDCEKARIPNGEKFFEFYERVTDGFDKIVKENFDKDILIVAHGGAISSILSHVTGAKAKGFWHFRTLQETYHQLVFDHDGFFLAKINHPIK